VRAGTGLGVGFATKTPDRSGVAEAFVVDRPGRPTAALTPSGEAPSSVQPEAKARASTKSAPQGGLKRFIPLAYPLALATKQTAQSVTIVPAGGTCMQFVICSVVSLALVSTLGACQGAAKPDASNTPVKAVSADPSSNPTMAGFRLTSSAIAPNQAIPAAYTCDGGDLAPPLVWAAAPAKAARLALILEDPDAPSRPFTHWIIFNLPVTDMELVAGGSLPFGTAEGLNSFGKAGYNGPCPPKGPAHRYHFMLYALDTSLSLDGGATRAQVDAAMQGHIVGQTELVGTYAHH
jgi:Raf kinase inhibitor-like YbhB/YbcL family protein